VCRCHYYQFHYCCFYPNLPSILLGFAPIFIHVHQLFWFIKLAKYTNLSELFTHLNTIHRDENNFSQHCGLPDCLSKMEYTSVNSFVKHVWNHHRTLLDSTYEAIWRGILDKIVIRSCVVRHRIVLNSYIPSDAISHPVCCLIVMAMPLCCTTCCYIITGVVLYDCSDAISSYHMLLYCTQ